MARKKNIFLFLPRPKMFIFLRNIWLFSREAMFPSRCFCCKRLGTYLCWTCQSRIPLLVKQICPLCQKIQTPSGQACFACAPQSSIEGVYCATSFKTNVLQSMIFAYKYDFARGLAQSLGEILKQAISHSDIPLPDIIIPVPLHPRRLRWRGFNQSSLLSTYLAQHLLPEYHITVEENILARVRFTQPQASIQKRKQRLANIENAFSIVSNMDSVRGKNIWCVDDISTTGGTLLECAKVLKKAGAKSVWGIALAR